MRAGRREEPGGAGHGPLPVLTLRAPSCEPIAESIDDVVRALDRRRRDEHEGEQAAGAQLSCRLFERGASCPASLVGWLVALAKKYGQNKHREARSGGARSAASVTACGRRLHRSVYKAVRGAHQSDTPCRREVDSTRHDNTKKSTGWMEHLPPIGHDNMYVPQQAVRNIPPKKQPCRPSYGTGATRNKTTHSDQRQAHSEAPTCSVRPLCRKLRPRGSW